MLELIYSSVDEHVGSVQFEATMNRVAKTHPVNMKTSTDSLFSKLCIYLASRSRFFDLKIKNFNQSFNLATPILIRGLGRAMEHETGCFFAFLYGDFLGCSDGKESACNEGDPRSTPGSGRFPGEENGYPLQYSCLENSMDRGAWWAADHGIAKDQTRLSN